MNFIYRGMQVIFYPVVKLFYPTKVLMKENYPKGETCILVSNHLKWVDVPLIAISIPEFRHLIAKKEIGKNPLIRWGTSLMKMVLVDREKPELGSIRKIINYLKNGESIGMFPEGTRNKVNEEFQGAKAGVAMFALKGGNPLIVPAMIYRRPKVWRKNYIYVDEPFRFDEFYGGKITPADMAGATELLDKKMRETVEKMHAYIENKGWKKDKAQRKQMRKDNKARLKAIKRAKREAKKAGKVSDGQETA